MSVQRSKPNRNTPKTAVGEIQIVRNLEAQFRLITHFKHWSKFTWIIMLTKSSFVFTCRWSQVRVLPVILISGGRFNKWIADLCSSQRFCLFMSRLSLCPSAIYPARAGWNFQRLCLHYGIKWNSEQWSGSSCWKGWKWKISAPKLSPCMAWKHSLDRESRRGGDAFGREERIYTLSERPCR
jgi:hypothetical protein